MEWTKINSLARYLKAFVQARENTSPEYYSTSPQPPVFVYQMGKVASSSVYRSILAQYPGPAVHGHNFVGKNRRKNLVALYQAWQKAPFPIKLISLVREPVGRNLSAFFEAFERTTRFKYADNNYSVAELHALFLERFTHNVPLLWLDNAILKNFGIDVYAQPFPAAGHQYFENGDTKLLLMRHDLPDDQKTALLQDYLNLPQFKLTNANVSADKPYAADYKAFKKIPLPDWYLDQMYHSRYARHFYGSQIAEFRKKWRES